MLVDCSWGFGNNGCDGGEEWRAYEWIMKHGGIATTETYGAYMGMVSKKTYEYNCNSIVLLLNLEGEHLKAYKTAITNA